MVSRCRKSHKCFEACVHGAISVKEDGFIRIEGEKCRPGCDYSCTKACVNKALIIMGSYVTTDELMRRLDRDRPYWGADGGVTLGGGEPMFQPEFAIEVLERCQQNYIHTAMETCGHARWEYYERALQHLDWLFFDIKHMNPARHREGTGKSNELILDNLERIVSKAKVNGKPCVIARLPLIPGYNDSEENIAVTAEFVSRINLSEVNILPFHRLGVPKWERLGREYKYKNTVPPAPEHVAGIKAVFDSYGVRCYIGANTPF